MTDKFNRSINVMLREIDGAAVGEIFNELSYLGTETKERLPYDISASFSKSMTSVMDTCRVEIKNPIILEMMYIQRDLFLDQLSEKDYSLIVFAGHNEDVELVYSGDLQNITVSGGSNITDQSLIMTASTGARAISEGKIKQRFAPGQTYLDIVNACFAIYEVEFGITLAVLDDPDLKLEAELKKSRTEDRYINETLNDICRKLDMTWGITQRQAEQGNEQGYFVDKKSVFDTRGIYGAGPHQVNVQTGLLSLPSFGRSSFSFSHRPDRVLNPGISVEVDWSDQINTATLFPGRINSIQASLSNKSGGNSYQCDAQFIGDDGLAKLNNDRKNVGGEIF